jgi:hydroxymethylpyrimidine pyrophosphatase-like HAD family hydrolase
METQFMSSPFLILTDLDHTLFQSLRSDPMGVFPMAVNKEGEDHGFARQDQKDMFTAMKNMGNIIPVTARSHQQMERVFAWETGQEFDMALTDLGANLLVRDNTGDAKWHAIESWQSESRALLEQNTANLLRDYQLLKDTFLTEAGLSDTVQVDLIAMGNLNVPLYFAMVVKDSQAKTVEHISEHFAKPLVKLTKRYNLHITNNIIALWPRAISKGQSVTRLFEIIKSGSQDELLASALESLNLEGRSVITVGDNMTDVEFMQHGDMMITPSKSSIGNHLASHAQSLMTASQ